MNRKKKRDLVRHRAMRKTLGFVKLLDLLSVIWSTLDEDAKAVAMSRPWYLRRFSKRCKASAARDPEEIDLPPLTVNKNRKEQKLVRHSWHSLGVEKRVNLNHCPWPSFWKEKKKTLWGLNYYLQYIQVIIFVTFTTVSYLIFHRSIEKGVRDNTPEKNSTSNAHATSLSDMSKEKSMSNWALTWMVRLLWGLDLHHPRPRGGRRRGRCAGPAMHHLQTHTDAAPVLQQWQTRPDGEESEG